MQMITYGKPKQSSPDLIKRRMANRMFEKPALKETVTGIMPGWFLDTVARNKAEIREIARNGGPRPGQKTKLGNALNQYTLDSKPNGPAFRTELTGIRPDWFDTVARNKVEILKMAMNGEPRPSQKTPLGVALTDYIRDRNSNGPAFRAELKAIRPDWFKN